MPFFGVHRQFAALFLIAICAVSAVSSHAETCAADLLGSTIALPYDVISPRLGREAAQTVEADGFEYTSDASCAYCMFNLQIRDATVAAHSIISRFGLRSKARWIEAEIPLVFEVARMINANVNVELHPDFLRFSLDMNGAKIAKILPNRLIAAKGEYQRLDVDFLSEEIRLKIGTALGEVVAGRTIMRRDDGGHGHGLLIARPENAQNLVISTEQARMKYFVGEIASPPNRLMLELARRLAWAKGDQIKSVIFAAHDGQIVSSRDKHF